MNKISIMYIGCRQYSVKRLLAILCLAYLLLGVLPLNSHAQNLIINQYKGVIVIDPGHGGHDRGAKGPEGTLEKTVTLNLARIIAVELGDTYKVVLTRNDDYWVDIYDRTATANHADADLFISLHVGGSFLHQASGMSVYYYKELSGPGLSYEPADLELSAKNTPQIPWEKIQVRHITTSNVLAKLILKRINEQAIFIKSKIHGLPLLVLEGADMPAVVVEVGYITNPAQEKSLRDINVLSGIAKGVHNAVDDFFKKTN